MSAVNNRISTKLCFFCLFIFSALVAVYINSPGCHLPSMFVLVQEHALVRFASFSTARTSSHYRPVQGHRFGLNIRRGITRFPYGNLRPWTRRSVCFPQFTQLSGVCLFQNITNYKFHASVLFRLK